MANVSKLKDGRRWTVDTCGVSALKRKYVVVCDEVTGENGEQKEFPGVPAIGSVHPVYKNLQAERYDVEEGEGVAKRTLTVTVNYAVFAGETGGSGQDATAQVEKWGWDSGVEEREMIDAVDGTAVLNSAGDVFDRVPTISVPAPTFTKVIKFRTRQNGTDNNCKVNKGSVTIGGRSYPEGSLLCLVSEERIIGDLVWAFRYTVQLKFRSNPVKLEGGGAATDIGWDVAITDAGMRELSADGKLKLIKAVDSETGRKCTVNSPELLDGNGHAVSRSGGATPKPYNIRFKAYERASFPNWFYSEPPMA